MDEGADAFEKLAAWLYLKLHHLDLAGGHSCEFVDWSDLPNAHRQPYRSCMRSILQRRSLVAAALEFANNDVENGRTESRE